jgi:hypothetical protein
MLLVAWLAFRLDHDGHANYWVYDHSGHHRNKMQFADHAIDASWLVACNFEIFRKTFNQRSVQSVRLSLEVLSLIPLNNRVFDLADAPEVTSDLLDARFTLEALIAHVSQWGFCRCFWNRGKPPLHWVDIEQAFKVEQADCDFNCIIFAYLNYWLDLRSLSSFKCF